MGVMDLGRLAGIEALSGTNSPPNSTPPPNVSATSAEYQYLM